MWVAKMKFWHKNSLTIEAAKKFNVTILAFPMNTVIEDNAASMSTGHLVIGEQKNKEKYFEFVKKQPRYSNVEIEGDFVVYEYHAPIKESHLQMYFTPDIMFIKPVTVKPDGYEYIEFGSWKKEGIMNLMKKVKKWIKIADFSISKEKVTDIYLPHLMPKLTDKQKTAVSIAYQQGYYEYPKKTNIEKLAKTMKLAPSTFQEHLRKAEEKLMPFLLENTLGR
jgi:predicted DNA binding protein